MYPLLTVEHLSLSFNDMEVIRDISFSMRRGRIQALVGESGSGKSMTAFSIMRLVPSPGRITDGKISLNGHDLLSLKEKEMRAIRGKDIAMIFQEPMTSLNPVLTVGKQLMEPMQIHDGLSPKEAKAKAIDLLDSVGIPSPETRFSDYPHQFSGGMRQRAMIAMALSCSPALLLADEPTTALDITIQRQILHLIKNLAQQHDMGVLLITHDLGVVAECADDVAVMYAGELLEQCPAEEFFHEPRHPYAQMLMECAPLVGNHSRKRLPFISGTVPQPGEHIQGCLFSPRCPHSSPSCMERQNMQSMGENHFVRCCLAKNL